MRVTPLDLKGTADSTIDSGLRYLAGRQRRDGSWRDFRIMLYRSDEWVTAYVALALRGCGSTTARLVAERALVFLMQGIRGRGGLGYSRSTPVDSDSTAIGLRALLEWGQNPGHLQECVSILRGHAHAETGAFQTYLQENLRTKPSTFVLPSPCVSATIGTALLLACSKAMDVGPDIHEGLQRFLAATIESEGWWHGRWWDGPSYPTRQVVEYLVSRGGFPQQALVVQKWRLAQREDGRWRFGELARSGAFETACGVDILLTCGVSPHDDAITRGILWLNRNQERDGSWQSDRYLMFPDHKDPYPWLRVSRQTVVADRRNTLVTAKVVDTLARLASALRVTPR